jgi:hypothetical protein
VGVSIRLPPRSESYYYSFKRMVKFLTALHTFLHSGRHIGRQFMYIITNDLGIFSCHHTFFYATAHVISIVLIPIDVVVFALLF